MKVQIGLLGVAALFVGLFSNALHAQEASPPIDIATAVQQGLKANPAVQQLRERLNEMAAASSLGRSGLFPTANLNAIDEKRKDSALGRSQGNTQPNGQSYDYYSLDLNVSQPLLVYGIFDGIKKIDLDQDVAKIDLQMAERNLTNNIIQAFYKTLASQRQWQLLSEELSIVQESLSTTEKRFKIGRGQLLDVLQVKTQLALLKPKIEDAHNQMTISTAQLATYLGIDDKTSVTLKNVLPSLKAEDALKLAAQGQPQLPELQRIEYLKEQNSAERNQLLGKDLPNLRFNFDYDFANYTKNDLLKNESNSWQAQLILTVPLFSGFSSRDEGKIYASRNVQLDRQLQDQASNLKATEISAKELLQTSDASLLSSEDAVNLANQSFKEANRNYKLATIDFVQYLQVQQSRLDAVLNFNLVKVSSITAAANYFVASGQDLNRFVTYLNQQTEEVRK